MLNNIAQITDRFMNMNILPTFRYLCQFRGIQYLYATIDYFNLLLTKATIEMIMKKKTSKMFNFIIFNLIFFLSRSIRETIPWFCFFWFFLLLFVP